MFRQFCQKRHITTTCSNKKLSFAVEKQISAYGRIPSCFQVPCSNSSQIFRQLTWIGAENLDRFWFGHAVLPCHYLVVHNTLTLSYILTSYPETLYPSKFCTSWASHLFEKTTAINSYEYDIDNAIPKNIWIFLKNLLRGLITFDQLTWI